jgi:hypothetical protein
MRLPAIQYDTEVQKRGRIQSRGPQIILQTAQMEAKGVREEGQMLYQAERNAGQLIANATNAAANNIAQETLSAEKYKNDKIADFMTEASAFNIKSKLEGDLLQIRETRDKYIIDREFERDYGILGTKAALARTQEAIKADAARKTFDINSQLKLDIAGMENESRMFETILNAGVTFAGIAADMYVANKNKEQDARSSTQLSDYKVDLAQLSNAVTSKQFIDLNDPMFEGMDIQAALPEGTKIHAGTNAAGNPTDMVMTADVGMEVYNAAETSLREHGLDGITSDAHIAELTEKMDVASSQVAISLVGKLQDIKNDVESAFLLETMKQESNREPLPGESEEQRSINIMGVAKKGFINGYWGADRMSSLIKEHKGNLMINETLRDLQDANSRKSAEAIKKRIPGLELGSTNTKFLISQADKRIEAIDGNIVDNFYLNGSKQLIPQRQNHNNLEGATDLQLKDTLMDAATKAGIASDDVVKMGDDLMGDLAAAHRSDDQEIQAVTDQAAPYIDNGQPVPQGVINQLPINTPARKQMVLANKKLVEAGHIYTDEKSMTKHRDKFNSIDGGERNKWAREFNPDDVRGEFDKTDIELMVARQKQIITGERDWSTSKMEINDTTFTKRANERFDGLKDGDEKAVSKADDMLWRINRSIHQQESAYGRKLEPDEVDTIVKGAFSSKVTVNEYGSAKQQKGGRFTVLGDSDLGIVEAMGSSLRPAVNLLEARGVTIDNQALVSLRNEATRQMAADGIDFSEENLSHYISNSTRVLATAEGAQYLMDQGKAVDRLSLVNLHTATSTKLEAMGKPATDANIAKFVDMAQKQGVSIDELYEIYKGLNQ